MAQKKLVNVKFALVDDLDAKIELGGKIYQDISVLIGEIDSKISILEERTKKGFQVTEQINAIGEKVFRQMEELGIKDTEVPSLNKANKFLDSYANLENKAKTYIK